jgi:crotonobetainyl-CoA:carnitine CoA-transferase CaiB-like acyl-CoA transferase
MQAFAGLRVIDLTHVIAGPFCSHQLAVMGAEVIKIEDTSNPDMMREEGVDLEANLAGMGSAFFGQNAGKKSLPLNLKMEEGREILRRLIKTSDVLVENYRSGALAALGFGYDDVCQIKPDIIYCSMTGFGQTGPKREHTAYDNVIQAYSGLMAVTGDSESGPIRVGAPTLDYGTGAQAAYAIACALFRRSVSGQGQYIDISMLDAALMFMSSFVADYQISGLAPAPAGNKNSTRPGYGCFDTKDGKLMIGAWTRTQTQNMWTALGDAAHGESLPKKHPLQVRDSWQGEVDAIQSRLMAKDANEWEGIMESHKVPAARVRRIDEALSSEQVKSRKVIQQIASDRTPDRLSVAAFQCQEDGPSTDLSAPRFGEHTVDVLTSLGYATTEISQLSADGVTITAD